MLTSHLMPTLPPIWYPCIAVLKMVRSDQTFCFYLQQWQMSLFTNINLFFN